MSLDARFREPARRARYRLVDAPRSPASSHEENHGSLPVQTELLPGSPSVGGLELAPDRVAGQRDVPRARQVRRRFLEARVDRRCPPREHARREPRVGVLLLQHDRYPESPAARIGGMLTKPPVPTAAAGRRTRQRAAARERIPATTTNGMPSVPDVCAPPEPHRRHGHELPPRASDQPFLYRTAPSHEEHLCARSRALQRLGYGYARTDVAARAASGDHHLHDLFSFPALTAVQRPPRSG